MKGSSIKIIDGKVDNYSVVKFKDLTIDSRSRLPSNFGKNGGNFGAAVIDVPEVQPLMAALSKLQKGDLDKRVDTLCKAGFVAQVEKPTFSAFTVEDARRRPIHRSVDTENKILNNIAAQLGNNTNVKGTIKKKENKFMKDVSFVEIRHDVLDSFYANLVSKPVTDLPYGKALDYVLYGFESGFSEIENLIIDFVVYVLCSDFKVSKDLSLILERNLLAII